MADHVLHIVSNTHWDREWYMSFERYRRRLVKLMDRLVDLLEKEPRYRSFTLDGQFIPIKDYLEIRPEQKERIKNLVQSGRLLIGPWYTQPNEFMAGGEAMVRNLLLGFRLSQDFGGVMRVCYLPDAFGHMSQLPQLAKEFGMSDVVVWRGLPRNAQTVFGWTGADGTNCLVYNILGGYGNATALPLSYENYTEYIDSVPIKRQGLDEKIQNAVSRLAPRTTSPHLLLLNGVDHSFAQNDLPEAINLITETATGLQPLHSDLIQYTQAVREHHNQHGIAFEQYQGELRDSSESEVLEDSQSTRASVKLWNGRVEALFEKWMESAATQAWLLGADYPANEIWQAWEYLLQNHAHDSMACSSVDETYRHVIVRFEQAHDLGEDIVHESLQLVANRVAPATAIPEPSHPLVVFNPLNWEQSEPVEVTIDVPKAWGIWHPMFSCGGHNITAAILDRRNMQKVRFNPRTGHPTVYPVERLQILIAPETVPSLGYKVLHLSNANASVDLGRGLSLSTNAMENEFFRVEFNANGTFDVFDKCSNRLFPGLHVFEDAGEAGCGFDRLKPLQDRIIYSTGCQAQISLVLDTPLRTSFRVDLMLELPEGLVAHRRARSEKLVRCAISSIVTLSAGVPRIDIQTTVDNQARDHRLRVMFPSGVSSTHSYAEQPFDVVARNITLPDLNDYPREKPSPCHPQLGFVDVSDGSNGLMVVNEGIYEYEVVDNQERPIALTLLRCLDRIDNWNFAQSEDLLIPEAQEIGEHVFRYSVIPHQGLWQEAYRAAKQFQYPMRAVIRETLEEQMLVGSQPVPAQAEPFAGRSESLPQVHSFLTVDCDQVAVSAFKKHETRDSLVVRLLNLSDEPVSTTLKANLPGRRFAEVFAVSLQEERRNAIPIKADGSLQLEIHGKGLFTVELVLG